MSNDTAYFRKVEAALAAAGVCQPTIVLDRERLDQNLAALTRTAPRHMSVRVVAKSLPSYELLEYVMERIGTDRLMTFNLPMLSELVHRRSSATHLLGKPFPVRAAAQFYQDASDIAEPDVQCSSTPKTDSNSTKNWQPTAACSFKFRSNWISVCIGAVSPPTASSPQL